MSRYMKTLFCATFFPDANVCVAYLHLLFQHLGTLTELLMQMLKLDPSYIVIQ
jgi:hypothetical protein